MQKPTQNQETKQAEALQSLNPKQPLKSIEDLFPKIILNTEAKDKINNKIKTIEQQIIRDNLIY